MITAVKVTGFKSFTRFRLRLEPFQVIVGPNAVGKSNLFDALKLLSRLAEFDIRTAFQGIRGEAGELFTVFPDGTAADVMRFKVDLLLSPEVTDSWGRTAELGHTRMRYTLQIRRLKDSRGLENLRLDEESLVPIRKVDDDWARSVSPDWERVPRYRSGRTLKPLILTANQNGIPTATLNQDGRKGRQRQYPIAKMESTLLSSLQNAEFPHGFAVREEMRGWMFLHLAPVALRSPSSRVAPERIDPAGQYLPNVLARMRKQDEYLLTDVSNDLANLVPGMTGVEVEEDQARDRFVIWVRTADGGKFSSRVLSDGTLRLLALAAIKNDPMHSGVLLLEEPENGVHPFRVRQVVSLLRDMTGPPEENGGRLRQLIVNTHSPTVVSQLQDLEMVLAETVRLKIKSQDQALRVTRMLPLHAATGEPERVVSREQVLRYLDGRDMEAAVRRLRKE